MSLNQSLPPIELPSVSKTGVIRVWDSALPGSWLLPSLSTTEVIPTLWRVLHLTCADWEKEVAAYSVANPHSPDYHLEWQTDAFYALKPRYIQCLFSYINFFFTIENGFQVLLSELGDISRELSLKLRIPKSPKRSSYIDTLRIVRNHTVVHWGGPDKKYTPDSRAGRQWGFSWPGKSTNLAELEFGHASSYVGAKDRRLKTIPETHQHCVSYLSQFDVKTTQLLAAIISHLPLSIGSRTYEHVLTKYCT